MKIILTALILGLLSSSAFCEVENLDETVARKVRREVQPYPVAALEDSTGNYIWQPESLQYTDVTTGAEVWKLSSTPGYETIYHDTLVASPWSADGKRIAFVSQKNTGAYTKSPESGQVWQTVNVDGSHMRHIVNAASREYWPTTAPLISWSPSEPDIYYDFGNTKHGLTSSTATLYKVTVEDTSDARSSYLIFPEAAVLNKTMSDTGERVLAMARDESTLYPALVYGGTAALLDADGYPSNRPHGSTTAERTYWGDTPDSWTTMHGQGLHGDGTWFHLMPSGSSVFWKFNTIGTAADGGSDYTYDTTYPYNWGGEAEPINTLTSAQTGNDPWCDEASYDCPGYMSHTVFDRWGTIALFNPCTGTQKVRTYDITTHKIIADWTTGLTYQHGSSSAWSDKWVLSAGDYNGDNDYRDDRLFSIKYDDGSFVDTIAYTHTLENSNGVYAGSSYEYTSLARPLASPDGTKIAFHSTFLNSQSGDYDDAPDIFFAVAYYPYPPEIISVSNGTVRFDWRTDQTTSRGYTQRGWPDESTDDPPPPRETAKFRLWKSANGSTGWAPVATVSAEIFTKYDFAEGTWSGNKYWEITDPDPSGYYAVTAVEHSGLESRVLSNVFSALGSQLATYPTSPGADTGITTAYNADLIRYYNIYAADGTAPAISQATRIASIPAGSGGSYIDWLGKTDGTTQYVVTGVDTQGNESTAIADTTTHQKTPATVAGQYTVEWTGAGSGTTNPVDPPTTGHGSLGIGSMSISSGGMTISIN